MHLRATHDFLLDHGRLPQGSSARLKLPAVQASRPEVAGRLPQGSAARVKLPAVEASRPEVAVVLGGVSGGNVLALPLRAKLTHGARLVAQTEC
jgi:hypothetical protein